jgi:hypothetical protein
LEKVPLPSKPTFHFITGYSISTGAAEYVTLDNKIKCLSLAVFFFFFLGNLTNKTGTGTGDALTTRRVEFHECFQKKKMRWSFYLW